MAGFVVQLLAVRIPNGQYYPSSLALRLSGPPIALSRFLQLLQCRYSMWTVTLCTLLIVGCVENWAGLSNFDSNGISGLSLFRGR
jgi:hypothetical protein